MQRLRNLIETALNETGESPRRYADRPGALFASGSVGEPGGRERQRDTSPAAGRADEWPGDDREQSPRRRRPAGSDQAAAATPADARTNLMAALRSPSALRNAVLLREVLDPPIALRDERRER